MTEKWLSQKIRTLWSVPVHTFESCGIPNVPDLYVPKGFWIELKIVATRAEKIQWRKGQQQWIEEHARAGGHCYLFVIVAGELSLITLRADDQVRSLSHIPGESYHVSRLPLSTFGVLAAQMETLTDFELFRLRTHG